ncbi:GAF domain-containing protein [Terrabacter sp. NPDC080008]|uniref:GAF domain-containing protein n=1 Tax=Terrabacter sp. NPDC080008 TaxID=3155176 RepID=UPI00344B00B5
MEPIPETHEALEELERFGDLELRGDLQRLVERAKERFPGLMGVSLGMVSQDLVLTYVASDLDVAALDGIQYADDGPCVEAVRTAEPVQTDVGSLLDEDRWRLFAQATAAAGIQSTLSLPFRHGGVVTGGVNLYGAAPDTFDGRVDELAEIFGAWAPGAVANADLSFETRLEAVQSPGRIRGQAYVDQAIGILVSARGFEPDAAEERLRRAAARAGVGVFVIARALVDAFDPDS